MSYNETKKVVGNVLQKYDQCSDDIKLYASTILVELSTVLEHNREKDSVLKVMEMVSTMIRYRYQQSFDVLEILLSQEGNSF